MYIYIYIYTYFAYFVTLSNLLPSVTSHQGEAPAAAPGHNRREVSIVETLTESVTSGVIKHGWLENPRTEWRFLARNITFFE